MWARAVLVVSSLVLLAGCGSDGSGASSPPERVSTAPVPVADGESDGPGTVIADGFFVPDGAVLIGAPLPIGPIGYMNGVEEIDDGWVAYLVVPGDPRDVIDQLRTQAADVGLSMRPVAASQHPEGSGDSFCQRDDAAYYCLGFASAEDPADTPTLTAEFHRRPSRGAAPAQSQMRLTYSDTVSDQQRPPLEFFREVGPSDSPLGPEPPAVPLTWAPLPVVGEPFGLGGSNDLDLEAGSELLMPLMLGSVIECGTSSYTALLAVTGDPDATVQGYIDQTVGPDSEAEPTGRTYDGVDDARLTVRDVSWVGGGGFTFGVVERPDTSTLLHITTCFG